MMLKLSSSPCGQVRPYALTLSLGLLDAQGDGDSISVCQPMVAACAWLLGEYNSDLEEPEVGRRTLRAPGIQLKMLMWCS